MKSKAFIFTAVLILIIIVTTYITSLIHKAPIQIGFVSALSGSSADLGFASRNALEMYVDDLNAAGGIKGRKIELTILDDQGDPNIAKSKFEALLDQNINLILGQVTSSSATLTIPYINEKDALFITPLVSHNGYMGVDDNFIAVIPSATIQGETLANHIMEKNTSGKIAIIYNNSNFIFSQSVFEGSMKQFDLNPQFETELFPLNESSEIPSIIEDIKVFDPTQVIVITSVSDLILISNQIKKTMGNIDIFSSMWGMAPEVISGYGKSMSNVYGVYAIDPNATSEKFLTFKEAYFNRYKVEANFAAIYTYDVVSLLTKALSETNSRDPKVIKEYIQSHKSYEGINSNYEINDKGDAIRKMFIIHAENGETIN